MRSDLNGTRSIVTGASRGFGRAIVEHLVLAGSTVAGVARSAEALAELHHRLGPPFTPVVGDVADDTLAERLIAEHQPSLVVLNAGATPHAGTLRDQTWTTFSRNWEVDVRHVLSFVRAALAAPLAPGSTVVTMSSGAARQGSPMSGGYAGAKATVRFISDYARLDSERHGRGVRFVSLLPKLTPATQMGSTFIDAYAHDSGHDRDAFLRRFGGTLSADDVAAAVVEIASSTRVRAAAYALTPDGLSELA